MKKTLLLTGLLLALAAPAFAVPGLNLAWEECKGTGGATLKTTACTLNTTAFIANAIGSIVAPQALAALNSAEITIDITHAGTSVPAWWDFGVAPACRPANALGLDYTNPIGASCLDYFNQFANPPSGGQSYQNPGPGGASHTQMNGVLAVDATTTAPISSGTEFIVFTLRIRATNTTTCAGCQNPASLHFNRAVLAQSGGNPSVTVDAPASGTVQGDNASNCAKWQANNVPCPGAVPTRTQTWGGLKSLYR
jgi:hypothetical protein